uniref:F-box domain-containing protein n=1 Tax=Caenorhabditis tropicalis TaxID=1561998 RepID=A0A1I7TNX1_9PELO
MHLLQIPVLALKEVFKMMNHKEIVVTSFTSKRAASIMQLCSIRTSSHIIFSPAEHFCHCKIGKIEFKLCECCFLPRTLSYHLQKCNLYDQQFDESTIRSFIERIVQIYHKPKVTLCFKDRIRDVFAVHLIRILNNGPLRNVEYDTTVSSEECYKRVFNEAATLESLIIKGKLTRYFRCSLSVPLNLNYLKISGSCDWIKLEDFMNCKEVLIVPNYPIEQMTLERAENLNLFFKKLKLFECKIEKFTFRATFGSSTFLKVVDGLSDVHGFEPVEFTRNGKKKSTITWTNDYFGEIIMITTTD